MRAVSDIDLTGKTVSNSAQWMMTVCTANAEIIISPSIIIALGTIVFVFSMLETALEYWGPQEWQAEEQE
jgi:hypothetical protein